MPGVVKKIQCKAGDSVVEGTLIVTLEAMKMQNPLFAPMTGIVRRRGVVAGSECVKWKESYRKDERASLFWHCMPSTYIFNTLLSATRV